MKPEQIRAELKLKKITQSAIARRLKCSPAHISKVIDGKDTNVKVCVFISDKIGKNINIVFPGKFINGKSRKGRPVTSIAA